MEARMHVVTDAEVLKYLADNQRDSGLHVQDRTLYYIDPEADCIDLMFPETPLRATYFARVATMLGLEDEGLFYGGLLWITLSDIGSIQLEKSGWKIAEKMRQAYGENRELQSARGHFFRSDELVDLTAFALLCFVFAWDAWLVGNNDFFVHISHDEHWVVVTRTREVHAHLLQQLKDLNPKTSEHSRARFCRGTR
jgi:hypothetical protein